jgi:hypothetical protein
LQVLDLCMRRQWHDALELLHQNGFTQYEWWEVVWFHDYAPTNLEPLACTVPSAPPLSLGVQPLGGPADPASSIELPATEGSTRTAANLNAEPRTDPEPLSLTPLRELRASVVNLNTQTVKPKRRRQPRSKVCGLPTDIQHSLNTMLANRCRYRDIIDSLNTRGYPGFNKVNLNAWKRTGFQDWVRSQPKEVSE